MKKPLHLKGIFFVSGFVSNSIKLWIYLNFEFWNLNLFSCFYIQLIYISMKITALGSKSLFPNGFVDLQHKCCIGISATQTGASLLFHKRLNRRTIEKYSVCIWEVSVLGIAYSRKNSILSYWYWLYGMQDYWVQNVFGWLLSK